MKRTITGLTLVLALVFTVNAWSQEPPMERGKMGMGKMIMGESSQMKSCKQMKSEMETTNAALDELVGQMKTAEVAEKMVAMEELLTALVAQRSETYKRMRSMRQMRCGEAKMR